jgi:hypothetical protein
MAVDQKARDFFAEAFSRPVMIEGKEMSTREAYIRSIHAKALAGDVGSHLDLFRLRQACGAGDGRQAGYLVVPEAMDEDDWARLAFEQQRPFREQSISYDR